MKGKILDITEIYRTILGESSLAGVPCTLIRLTGCNLRCKWCDTKNAYSGGHSNSIDQIIRHVRKSGNETVLLTGGEPLFQENAFYLIDKLISEKFKLLVETNGSIDISGINKKARVIMDVKTPSSGMSHKNRYSNLKRLKKNDEVKFVIANRKDYLWSRRKIQEHNLERKCTVLLSPVYKKLEPSILAGWLMEAGLNALLNLQVHKIIGLR